MSSLAAKLLSALRRDRGLPLSELAGKIASNATAYAEARLFLRRCDSVGPRARCFGRPDIENSGTLRIGSDFAVSCTFGTVLLATAPGATLTIGDGVTINYGCSIAARQRVEIGDGAKIAPFCVIVDADAPPEAELPPGDEPHAIYIGKNVWLGVRVTVLPGARIGDGTVVSAGSVVSGELPAHAVASGNPARVLRVSAPPPPPSRSPSGSEAVDARAE